MALPRSTRAMLALTLALGALGGCSRKAAPSATATVTRGSLVAQQSFYGELSPKKSVIIPVPKVPRVDVMRPCACGCAACWVAALIASIVERHSDRFCFANPAEAAMCRGLITFIRTQMAWILALLLLLVFGGALAGMLTMTDA